MTSIPYCNPFGRGQILSLIPQLLSIPSWRWLTFTPLWLLVCIRVVLGATSILFCSDGGRLGNAPWSFDPNGARFKRGLFKGSRLKSYNQHVVFLIVRAS